MSTTYAPDTTYHWSVRVLTDDDPQIAASYNVCLEDVADNAAAAYTGLITEQGERAAEDAATRALIPGYNPTVLEVDLSAAYAIAGWNRVSEPSMPRWRQNTDMTGGDSYRLWIPLVNALPRINGGVKITSVGVTIHPGVGHSGVPSERPYVILARVYRGAENPVTGVEYLQTVAMAATLPDAMSYEAQRNIAGSLGTPHAINTEYLYYLLVGGESGTNYMPGLMVQAARLAVEHV